MLWRQGTREASQETVRRQRAAMTSFAMRLHGPGCSLESHGADIATTCMLCVLPTCTCTRTPPVTPGMGLPRKVGMRAGAAASCIGAGRGRVQRGRVGLVLAACGPALGPSRRPAGSVRPCTGCNSTMIFDTYGMLRMLHPPRAECNGEMEKSERGSRIGWG
jgi:hypothetical protein